MTPCNIHKLHMDDVHCPQIIFHPSQWLQLPLIFTGQLVINSLNPPVLFFLSYSISYTARETFGVDRFRSIFRLAFYLEPTGRRIISCQYPLKYTSNHLYGVWFEIHDGEKSYFDCRALRRKCICVLLNQIFGSRLHLIPIFHQLRARPRSHLR